MPRQLLFSVLLVSVNLLAACQSKPEDSSTSATQAALLAAPATVARPSVAEAKQLMANAFSGTYRQATDSTNCDCDLAVTVWRAGRQLRYRIENYPEKGLVTADSADGRRGLSFVSTSKPHEEAHEWSGSLEGDTLLVQTYGNSMNEYENFVGSCGCKFLTLVKQR